MTRQRAYSLRRIAAGRCATCGDPRGRYATLCDGCRAEATRLERERYRVVSLVRTARFDG